MPAVGRALVNLSRKYRQAAEQYAAISARLGEDRQAAAAVLPSTPFEEVRDFFYLQHNYIAELDDAAEAIAGRMELPIGRMTPSLVSYLESRHGVTGPDRCDRRTGIGNAARVRWPHAERSALSPSLDPGQQAFQLATQIAILELDEAIRRIVDEAQIHQRRIARARPHRARELFRRCVDPALRRFSCSEAERCRYDIELLSHRFGVGFETICHRLSTLAAPAMRGACRSSLSALIAPATYRNANRRRISIFRGSAVPVRSGTSMKLSPARDGSLLNWRGCPMSEPISGSPGRCRIGREDTAHPPRRLPSPWGAMFAMRSEIVYSQGLKIDPSLATPIGMGCKVWRTA